MKLLILSILILMNTACSQDQLGDILYGPPKDPRTNWGIDPELIPFVNQYEIYSGIQVVNIPVTFAKLEVGIAGTCYIWEVRYKEFREIRIDPEGWDDLSEASKQEVVFHELHHCAADHRHHIDDVRDDGCPFSMMYPSMITDYCLEKYEDDYIFNLFH